MNQRVRCPRRPIFENPELFNRLIGAYNNYDAGILPKSGGMNDQHAKFPTLMGVFHRANDECDIKLRAMRE